MDRKSSIKGSWCLSAALMVLLLLCAQAVAGTQQLGTVPYNLNTSCAPKPKNCTVVGKVTGFQEQVSTGKKYVLAQDGRVVAWGLALGVPGKWKSFFDGVFGTGSKARLVVLRQSTNKKKSDYYRLIGESEDIDLEPYFGTSPTFALSKPIKAKKGDVVGITVATWAPIFRVGLASTYAWRAAKPKSRCNKPKKPGLQTQVGSLRPYQCTFSTAQLAYQAQVEY